MNDTAIVIVTHNSASEIGACLDAALPTGAEIVVLDNQSRDNTCAEVQRRQVRLIANAENLGFAAAVNQGFRVTAAPFVLLLNPDAVLLTAIDPLRRQCALPGVGAAGGQLTGADGRPQAGFMVRRLPTPAALCLEVLGLNRLWPRNPVNWRFRCYDLDPREENPVAVEQPAGAFLMVNRHAWESLGGFDEQFHPLWFEDVDFCYRMNALGLKVFYVPEAVAKHDGAHSIRSIRVEQRQIYWYGSLLRYAAKHYAPFARRSVCASVMIGSVFRSVSGLFSRQSLTQFKVFGRVIGLAGRYF
jgi:N-acetylglucosaminyl-diphospho-decaprenol L-rhamnosyltransferase